MKNLTIDIPDGLYDRLQQIAQATQRSPEAVLLESFAILSEDTSDVGPALEQLDQFTVPQLWAVVYRRLPWTDAQRLHTLLERGNQGQLTPTEREDLDQLTDRNNDLMLLRSKALRLLHERGVDVQSYLQATG